MISAVLDVQAVVLLLRTQARVVSPPDTVAVTGDPEDDHVLATAAYGQAEYLITADKQLLSLARHGSTQSISPRQALALHSLPSTPE